jgi:hypothetical protein
MEGCGLNVFGVELGSVIHMQDVLSEFMVGGEIVPADKTLRIKILLYPRITPVDWNGVHMEGIHQLFRAPTGPASVFEGEVETIASEPINFYLVAVTGR